MTSILYTSNQCPYCVRSIATLKYAQQDIELRNVDINKLPSALTGIKSKPMVPFLKINNSNNLDESWDIIKWALQQNDPDQWLDKDSDTLLDAEMLIETNDSFFAPALYQYQQSTQPADNRADCEEYLEELEEMLNEQRYLISDQLTLADISVLPFINLMSQTEPKWFAQAPYPKLHLWMSKLLEMPCLKTALTSHELWHANDPILKL